MQTAPLTDIEYRIEDREWLPGADRRSLNRRLAERRAPAAKGQTSASEPAPAKASMRPSWMSWSTRDLTLFAVSVTLGFLGGLYVASSSEERQLADPAPTFRLDRNIEALGRRDSTR